MDRVAYTGVFVYSLINILWIVWVFSPGVTFGIFRTAGFIGLFMPLLGLVTMIGFQCSSRECRFSILANLLSLAAMGGWFIVVWSIVAAASAAV